MDDRATFWLAALVLATVLVLIGYPLVVSIK